MPDEPVIVAARRTPIGTRSRALAELRPEQLAAPVIRATLADAEAATGSTLTVADVVLGNCMGPGGNLGRVSALAAGLGVGVPGVTVDRQCGSGLAAVLDAVSAIRAGDDRPRIAGGVESASTAPTRSVDGVPYDRAPFAPSGWPDPDMVRAAEDLAQADAITRERQDAYAARSHGRARAARDAGRFDAELVPLGDVRSDDSTGVTESLLARLNPLIPGGTVTAGTSTRISDGAATVSVVPHRLRAGAPGLVVLGHATVGCDPALPGIGAAPAVLAALAAAEVTIGDVAAVEIVEAFAAQSLAVLGRIGVDDDDPRVCVDGGALALGHPWGASGAVSLVRLFSRLVRSGAPAGTLGMVAASVGGGMGVAAVVEVLR
ncbi:thiolase family protein [Promicromonospora citrea]|uniref:Acetyl-CoA acetyltransferase n=1 Tax=Promicromonospora citrea TaxID=43677 RepID=A0A8H9GED5_9MICO|nr:thiolase family protein [Promicromonospora citrea]NNH52201.1 thiolase family protein [Promicromonospora citrea]GGM14178.1 acetyl-CoA acetyltransferase [Promicromonospora citrea]